MSFKIGTISTKEGIKQFSEAFARGNKIMAEQNFNEYFAIVAVAHWLRWQNLTRWQRVWRRIKAKIKAAVRTFYSFS